MESADWVNVGEHLVSLVGHLIWPLAAIALAFRFHEQVKSILTSFAKRVSDPNSNITLGKLPKIETELGNRKAEVETLRVESEQALQMIREVAEFPEQDQDPEVRLSELGAIYMSIHETDWGKRVRLKEEQAHTIASYILRSGVSRDDLAQHAEDGVLVGLATAMITFPEQEDPRRILDFGPRIGRPHVKYRTVMAIAKLIDEDLVPETLLGDVADLLNHFRVEADPKLTSRIDGTFDLIRDRGSE